MIVARLAAALGLLGLLFVPAPARADANPAMADADAQAMAQQLADEPVPV